MSAREPKFWGVEGAERVTRTSLDEAVEDYLDEWGGFSAVTEDDEIEVCGFAPMTPTLNHDWLVEHALEALDEEYGDTETYTCTKPTPAMLAAGKAFVAAILAEYEPWACEVVERRQVRVLDWVRTHRPEWLTEAQS